MSDYPIRIIAAYRSGEITKQQFQKQFGDWQKANGINYDCMGFCSRGLACVAYRGVHAVIRGGVLEWGCGEARGVKKGRCRKCARAQSIFEFRRKVDFLKNRGAAWM